jgi:four helix bundle protein
MVKYLYMKTHKDLEAWKNSIKLVADVYDITRNFPKDELFGLTAQIRRAAVSVASNISEGAARNTKKEFVRFLHISMGSLAEVETQLIISDMQNYLNKKRSDELQGKINQLRAQLSGLIKSIQVRIQKGDGVKGDKVTR